MGRGNIRVRGTTQRRRGNLAARAAPWRVATCKRYGHEMRGTIRRDNRRKQWCAAALTVRGTIANNDVDEAATNETIRVAAIHKKIIYVCNGRHGRYSWTCQLAPAILPQQVGATKFPRLRLLQRHMYNKLHQ